MIDAAHMSKVKALSAKERIELGRAVWESLDQSEVPFSAAERDVLDARLKDLEQNPSHQRPWFDVKTRLRKLIS